MKHEQAQITTLFSMAIKCKRGVNYDFTKFGGKESIHSFESQDVFLVTVFAQMRMIPHDCVNEAKGEEGPHTIAACYQSWEFVHVAFHRHDGVVQIPVRDLRGESSPFRFVRMYNDKDTPWRRTDHLCNAACWYGAACKINLAYQTPEETEAISF